MGLEPSFVKAQGATIWASSNVFLTAPLSKGGFPCSYYFGQEGSWTVCSDIQTAL